MLDRGTDKMGRRDHGLALDVGSGNKPLDDVNVDLPDSDHHRADQGDPTLAPNFIYADGQKLPFRSVFNFVSFRHVLEHIGAPLDAIGESYRVLKRGELLIVVPSQFNVREGDTSVHLYTWNPQTLRNLVARIFSRVETGYLERFGVFNSIRKISLLNALLSKMGFYPEIYARARKWGTP